MSNSNPTANKSNNKNQQEPAFIQYNGMNDGINYLVLHELKKVMLAVDLAWHHTFFVEDKFNQNNHYDYTGLEPMLNFYAPFKTGHLSWQVNEDEWHKKSEIDAKCRKQMMGYYRSQVDDYDGARLVILPEDRVLAEKLFKQLLNQIYNKCSTGGGHTSTISIGDFRKDMNKGSGILWTNDDIDWDAYNAKVESVTRINQIQINVSMGLYSYMKKNDLFFTKK